MDARAPLKVFQNFDKRIRIHSAMLKLSVAFNHIILLRDFEVQAVSLTI